MKSGLPIDGYILEILVQVFEAWVEEQLLIVNDELVYEFLLDRHTFCALYRCTGITAVYVVP